MGVDADGEKVNDYMKTISQILLNSSTSNFDKARLIALYVLIKKGISEQNFNKLATHAEIKERDKDMILGLTRLGVSMISDVSRLT